MRVLLTRPSIDNEPLAEKLALDGIATVSAPLLEIVFEPAPSPELKGVQGLLFTSANGVRAFSRLSDERKIKCFAVGDATAKELAQNGFADVESAGGDVESLARLVAEKLSPAGGALYHAAGTHLAGDLAGILRKNGFAVSRDTLYRAVAADALPAQVIAAIGSGEIDAVLLYSPRTAKTFAGLVRAGGLEQGLGRLVAFCLSGRVADGLSPLALKEVVTAPEPTEKSLLALVVDRAKGQETRG